MEQLSGYDHLILINIKQYHKILHAVLGSWLISI